MISFRELQIREDNRVSAAKSSEFKGDFANEFCGDENGRVFYYYVDQALCPVQSLTILSQKELGQFYIQHEAEVEFYSLQIQSQIHFKGVSLLAYKDDNPDRTLSELLEFFQTKFDRSEYQEPIRKESARTISFEFGLNSPPSCSSAETESENS